MHRRLNIINCNRSSKLLISCIRITKTLFKNITISIYNLHCVLLDELLLISLTITVTSHYRITLSIIHCNTLCNIPLTKLINYTFSSFWTIKVNTILSSPVNQILRFLSNSSVNRCNVIKEHHIITNCNIQCLRNRCSNTKTTCCTTSNQLRLSINNCRLLTSCDSSNTE